MTPPSTPVIIQGGMGVGVSSWQLASAVSRAGQLGVVSGTALDATMARRLQDGDQGGHIRRALEHFPLQDMVQRALDRYYRPEGRGAGEPYTPTPRLALKQSIAAQELSVLGNFAEVWLAKDGHDGLIGINFLEKVQMATPPAAYGALIAGVDYVLMGAGIPREIPQLLNRLANHEPAALRVDVIGASDEVYRVEIDPAALTGDLLPPLKRPQFLAIVSSHVIAEYLSRDEVTRPDGFVVEGPRAGGHNAPPRGKMVLDDAGEPVFGPRDEADLARMARTGLPFWLAGSQGTPSQVAAAGAAGAQGVQVGTLFALCEESGITPDLRKRLLEEMADGTLKVRTDPLASPTGFPFKVAQLDGTQSEQSTYEARPRLCDLGYLRVPYVREGGALGYRCAAEPVHTFVRKGGSIEDTVGRKCLCNGLTVNVGLGQTRRDGYSEEALVTLGSDVDSAEQMRSLRPSGWSATQAVEWLLSDLDAAVGQPSR